MATTTARDQHHSKNGSAIPNNSNSNSNNDDDKEFDSSGKQQEGYQGFGSFHNENVEELVALSDKEYAKRRPTRPDFSLRIGTLLTSSSSSSNGTTTPSSASASSAAGAFGDDFFQRHFQISSEYVFVNHGAFGGALRGAVAIKRKFEDLMEEQLLTFIDRRLLPLMVESIRSLASFLGCKPSDVVLVPNATTGLNSGINSLINSGDVVAFLDSEYLSVYKMMRDRCAATGCSSGKGGDAPATLYEIPVHKFLHDSSIMGDDVALTKYLEEQLPKGCTAFVIDLITSSAALHLPVFSHIIPMLRRNGVRKIIVDAAHGPLQCDISMEALPEECRPTVLVGNLHKWVSCPKSVGFMWVAPDAQDAIRPAIVSHGSGDGFLSSFVWDGTRDYGACLTVPAVVSFWQDSVGVTNVRKYCTTLLEDAAAMMTSAFKSRRVARHAPFMTLVELPDFFQHKRYTGKYIQDTLHDRYKVELPVKNIEGRLYVRISAFVYNTMQQFEHVRDSISDLAARLDRKRDRDSAAAAGSDHNGGNNNGTSTPPCEEARKRGEGGCGTSGLGKPPVKKTRKF